MDITLYKHMQDELESKLWTLYDSEESLQEYKITQDDCYDIIQSIRFPKKQKITINLSEKWSNIVKEEMQDYPVFLRQSKRGASGTTPRNGVNRKIYEKYLKSIGWKWVAVMGIGTGCRMHVKESELPSGRLILRLSKHLTSTIDGVLHDTYDCSRDGTRAVYGYFIKES